MEDKQPEMMRFAHKSFKFPSDVSKLRSKWRVGARLIDLDVFSEGDISLDKCHGGGVLASGDQISTVLPGGPGLIRPVD